MKALVIGGTGPTGPHIVNGLLQRGFVVTVLHSGKHEVELAETVEHLHGDPNFQDTLAQTLGQRTFDLVICTYGRLRNVVPVIVGRTPRFISVGAAAYQSLYEGRESQGGAPVSIAETAPLQTDPQRNKFWSLIAASESTVMAAHRQGHFLATHFRYPPLVYGPRQLAPVEWSIIRRFRDGRRTVIVPDGGLALISRGYAENLAHAVLLAVDDPVHSAGESFNAADEGLVSIREWVTAIARAMDWQFDFVDLPYRLARPCHPYVHEPCHMVLDIRKLQGQLSYRDRVPLPEALQRTVRWLLENPPVPGGELEQQLRDPFNYEAEDRLVAERATLERTLLDLPFSFEFVHPYAHPKRAEPAVNP